MNSDLICEKCNSDLVRLDKYGSYLCLKCTDAELEEVKKSNGIPFSGYSISSTIINKEKLKFVEKD